MLAKLTNDLPEGDGTCRAIKQDGFVWCSETTSSSTPNERRSPATSRSSSPLREQLPERCVLDGEIVVPSGDERGLNFDALLQRIHPAESACGAWPPRPRR